MKFVNIYIQKLGNKIAFILLSIVVILISSNLFSQVAEEWVARYDGLGDDYAYAIALDSSGNVYVTGYSGGSGTYADYATIKYNNAGVEQWVARYDGLGNWDDEAKAIALDSSGNVYVTGWSYGSGTSYDYAMIKYNSAGVEQWVARYDGPGNYYDSAHAIALDSSGNVYVTGESTVSGTYPDYNYDYATIKYNSAGGEEWVARYNGPGNYYDFANAIAIDSSGNVYVTGESYGSGSYNYDYATIKYNSSGIEQWVARYNGPVNDNDVDCAYAIALDSSGNVYVTGESAGSGTYEDYATIKYNSSGVEEWVARYNGPENQFDGAYAIALDSSGNVYVTGYSWGSVTYCDYATIKYNDAGVQQWVARYNGPGNWNDAALAIALDSSGNVYVTGYSSGSGTDVDYVTIKYNSSGVEQWVMRYNGPGNYYDEAYAIALDSSGNVYVTGYSYGSDYYSDYATIKYSQNPPQITKVIFSDCVTANQSTDPGELIILQFDQIMEISGAGSPVTILPQDFYLTGGASLGTDSTMIRSTNDPTQIIITLGTNFSGITITGNATGIDIGANIRSGLIYNPVSLIEAQDGGVPDVNDTAIDMKFAFTPNTTNINASTGGTVGLNPGADNTYSKHQLYIPPGALSENKNFSIVTPFYPSNNLVIPTGARFITSNPKPQSETINFSKSVTLTLEYNPDIYDIQNGFMEKYIKIFELKEITPGSYEWVLVPNTQTINFTDKTVSVEINALAESQEASGDTGGTYGTLPIATVDENSISIKPSGGSPRPPRLTLMPQSNPTLLPKSTGMYILHTIEFPGYVECASNDPQVTRVRIRQATLTERVGTESGYIYFPGQSGAVFTIVTTNSTDSITAFSSPVNMTVQYILDPDPNKTDVVNFYGMLGNESQMRICKSSVTNPPNYWYVTGSQTVDTVNHTVSINNLSNLTSDNGICMYGVVCMPPTSLDYSWELFE